MPSMDSFNRGLFVHAATCLYAAFGFSLSVLAALISYFDRRPRPTQPIQLLQRRPKPSRPSSSTSGTSPASSSRSLVRIYSDETPSQPKSILNRPSLPSGDAITAAQMRKRMLASHRRSRSIPIITIDYFASTANLRSKGMDSNPAPDPDTQPLNTRKPLTFVLTTPDRERPRSKSTTDKSEGQASDVKDAAPRLKRGLSSPELPSSGKRVLTRRATSSDLEGKMNSQSDTEMRTRKKIPRNMLAEEKLTTRFEFGFSRMTDKKKTLPPRTQPYDAPYNCSNPSPPGSLRKAATVNDVTKLIKKKSSKLPAC